MNKKKEEQINIIENGAINLIKSTAGKKNEIRNNNKNILKQLLDVLYVRINQMNIK